MIVRRLQDEDGFTELIPLSRHFFAGYEGHHECFFQIERLLDEQIVAYFQLFLDDPLRAAFIAVVEERIIGYITVAVQEQPAYWKVRRVGHISGLMVHPDVRRQGVAHALLDAARAFFAEQGVAYYTVYTAVQNRAAIAFYQKEGMEPLYTHLVGEVG